jgi:MYXO-CTERM domain-containing protein
MGWTPPGRRPLRFAAGLIGALALGLAPRSAEAFLLAGGSAEPHAVIARDGRTSVLTVYAKKGGQLTLVVAAPRGATPKARMIRESELQKLLGVTQPRIEETWEQDPCELHSPLGPGAGPAPLGPASEADKKAADVEPKATEPPGATSLGEGREVVLPALEKLGVKMSPALSAEVDRVLGEGMQLFAVPLRGGADWAVASLAWESDSPGLPVGLLAASGARELDLTVLSRDARQSIEGAASFALPTNLDLAAPLGGGEGALARALVSAVWAKEPKAVITRHSWVASQCEGCAAPLTADELGRLGVADWPSARTQGELLVDAQAVSDEPGGPDDLRVALTQCAEAAKLPAGDALTVQVTVASGTTKAEKPRDDAYGACVAAAVEAAELDKSGALKLTWQLPSRAYVASLVVTRLAVPLAADTRVLELSPRAPIEGGREIGPNGKPEARVFSADKLNNYQARFVVRHPWKGPVACQSPERGVWGGPPKGAKPTAPKKVGKVDLAKALVAGPPDLEAFKLVGDVLVKPDPTKPDAAKPDPSKPDPTKPSASPSAPAAGSGASPAPAPGAPEGCACETASPTSPPRGFAAWLLLALAAGLSRRRARADR